MISNVYETLGVSSDATPEEVKKAYFKLIRVHSPQNDPQGFQNIRQAYEAYLKGDFVDPDAFEINSPEEKAAIDQLSRMLDQRNYAQAKADGAKFVEKFPKSDQLRYLYCIALRKCNNTTLAVRALEPLIQKHSKNKLIMREYAFACDARGWTAKASTAYENAFQAGIVDPEFISSYLDFLQNKAVLNPITLRNIIKAYFEKPQQKWSESTVKPGLNIAFFAAKHSLEISKSLKALVDIITQVPSAFDASSVKFFCDKYYENIHLFQGKEDFQNFEDFLQASMRLNFVDNSTLKEHFKITIMEARSLRLHYINGLTLDFCARFMRYSSYKSQNAPERYLRVNMMLAILLEDPRFTKEQEASIAQDFPDFYKIFQPTFYKLQLPENKLQSYIKQLLKEEKNYSRKYETFYNETYDDVFNYHFDDEDDDDYDYDYDDDDFDFDDDDYDDDFDFFNPFSGFGGRGAHGEGPSLEELEALLKSPGLPKDLKEILQALIVLKKAMK